MRGGPGAQGRGRGRRRTHRQGGLLVTVMVAAALWLPISVPARGDQGNDRPLRVGTSGDYAPFTIRSDGGQYQGFDVEVARAFASDRGRSIVLVPFRWPELRARLLAGDFDVAMGGITVRGDRLALAPMSATVARTQAVLVTRAGTAAIIKDWTALVVGVNRGGHLEQVARSRLPQAKIVTVDDNLRLSSLLLLGEVDAIVTDTLEVARFPSPEPGTSGESPFQIAQVLSHDRKAYWVSPRAGPLVEDLDRWLSRADTEELLERLRTQYFGGAVEHPRSPRAERVADLVGRRLMLMPAVAWAKRAAGRPIEDASREEIVERAGSKAARDAGLEESSYLTFVRTQFAVSKLVQKVALLGVGPHAGQGPEEGLHQLTQVLRPALDRIDRGLAEVLSKLDPEETTREELTQALRADAPVAGFDDDAARLMAGAILKVAASRTVPAGR